MSSIKARLLSKKRAVNPRPSAFALSSSRPLNECVGSTVIELHCVVVDRDDRSIARNEVCARGDPSGSLRPAAAIAARRCSSCFSVAAEMLEGLTELAAARALWRTALTAVRR